MSRLFRCGIITAVPEEAKVLYLRDIPTNLANKLKAAAALSGASIQQYIVKLLQAHVADLERKGQLPKSR